MYQKTLTNIGENKLKEAVINTVIKLKCDVDGEIIYYKGNKYFVNILANFVSKI